MSTVVEQIRKARDLMNHSGRHWIKGAAHAFVGPNHTPGSRDDYRSYASLDTDEHAYCSIGALSQVKAHPIAWIEVAKALRPKRWAQVEKGILNDAKKYGYSKQTINEELKIAARDLIVDVNDLSRTKWPEIRNAFTQAALRVSQRKES